MPRSNARRRAARGSARRRRAEVGGDQRLLDLVERRLVERGLGRTGPARLPTSRSEVLRKPRQHAFDSQRRLFAHAGSSEVRRRSTSGRGDLERCCRGGRGAPADARRARNSRHGRRRRPARRARAGACRPAGSQAVRRRSPSAARSRGGPRLERRAGATCGIRAAGVPGRGREGEDVAHGRCRNRRSARACCSNIASVSVGKPAIRSAPIAMSGRAAFSRRRSRPPRRGCGGASSASGSCRRPPGSDRWRCGITRGSAAAARTAGRRSRSQSSDDSRRRGSAGTCAQDALDQQAERRRARQIGAVAGEVDAGQHDLAEAAVDQRRDPLDHRAGGHRAAVAAAERDDAEGAAMVAARSAPRRRRARARQGRRRDAARSRAPHDVADAHRAAVGARSCRAQLLAIAEHPVDLGHRGEALPGRSARRSR